MQPDNNSTIPELEEFYDTTSVKSERGGMAWLLACASLVATLAVIGGIFLGGRWLYRNIAINNTKTDKVAVVATPTIDNTSTSNDSTAPIAVNTTVPVKTEIKPNTSTPVAVATPAPKSNIAVTAPTPTPLVQATQAAVSTSGLPKTGPSTTMTIALFAGVALSASLLHGKLSYRKNY
jgi:LPXTG-motif cell wall-anchored protein